MAETPKNVSGISEAVAEVIEERLFQYRFLMSKVSALLADRKIVEKQWSKGVNDGLPMPKYKKAGGSLQKQVEQLLQIDEAVEKINVKIKPITDTVELLNERHKEFVWLRYFQEKSPEVVWGLMGLSKSAYYRMRQDVLKKFALRMTNLEEK